METNKYKEHKIAVVIPYYNAEKHIVSVVSKLPDYLHALIIVDDKSPQPLPKEKIKSEIHPNINCIFLENEINLGVGGATKTGFAYAINNEIDIVIKVDADDQMDLKYIPNLLDAIINEESEMAKGNRFKDFKALNKMPAVRRMGNFILSFLIKAATGYWNNFDPTNGFLAIKTKVLKEVDFSNLSNRYYFETSLLAELYFQKTRIKDIAMPAIYGDEKSSMQVWKMPFLFGTRLIKTFFKRILKGYFLYDFNVGTIYILFGLPLFLFGVIYGISQWIHYASLNTLTPTGTIMIIALSIILGFQLVLQAVQYDIINAPTSKK